MKYIIIGVITVVIIFILFNQFGGKKENNVISQNTNSFETKENTPEQEKPTFGIL
jgi:H+/gluconate symporter-like permease